MTLLALDSSVAVPLLVTNHRHHNEVTRWWRGREGALAGHALADTYSVLTRLPSGLRATPPEVARVLADRFAPPVVLGAATTQNLPALLAARGVCGDAVYDALVALAAKEHGLALATRDRRARDTYGAVGAETVLVG